MDCSVRWHYRRFERHDQLRRQHYDKIQALQPEAARLHAEATSSAR